ncbi:hypothetical protein RHSP_32000 [Rhizobium freirei PRF 81]|uniref:GIY-YIG domain-containing protein n=1 Tax=Rhizobium freirei PRF 81 TaxID=363754 RepID=N6UZE4_9HYPH|nr:hypothetical protein [Rhizobium freirei]ENN86066.1 hypothetical protein RHSP_32000 [Rhizobium freirei PRF 81]
MIQKTFYFVYLLTFSNGKVYVGMSKTHQHRVFSRRYQEHRKAAKAGNKSPVYSAWRKYGDPQQEVLSLYATRESCALAEIEAILTYNSTDLSKGYNLMAGGEGLNAPPGSSMYELMEEKVWKNAERCRKISESLKGRPPSSETIDGYKAWRKTDTANAIMREKVWDSPEWRKKLSDRTREQMANGGAEHLRQIKTGRPDHLSPETRAIVTAKQREFSNSPKGKEYARQGYEAMCANPENVANALKRLEMWRNSDVNADHCRKMASLAAAACSRKVRHIKDDIEFASQREMAVHYGVSDAAVSRWIKNGKAIRI